MNAPRSLTLCIATVATAFFLAGCGSSADSTANHFMSLLVAGKHLEAQEMLSKDMRSMATMLGGVSNQSLNPYYRSGQFKSFTLAQTEKTNNSVRYKVRAITADGQGHDDFLDLTQEDGKWRISRF
jgi:major membrane immunogen (membrane-anchored lipoprotein)